MTTQDDEDGGIPLNVRCRAQSGATAVLPVLDISPGGCMVPCKGWEAIPGERVLTTLGGLGVRPSRLVWVEDGRAGIAFDEVLHYAVYDLLRARLDGTYVDLAAQALQREQEEEEKKRPGKRHLA